MTTVTLDRTPVAGGVERAAMLGRVAVGASLGLTLLPAGLFAVGAVLLLAGPGITPLTAGLGIAVVGAGALYAARRVGGGWLAPAAVAALTVVALLFCRLVLDTSADGQMYHYDGVRALAHGWNPYRQPFRSMVPWDDDEGALYTAFYPQGSWIATAMQMAAGLDAESAKTPAFLLAAALFLAVYGAAAEAGLGWLRALALAGLSAANPVIIVQLFSRMNDGMLISCLGVVAAYGALWLRERNGWLLLGMGAAIAYALNLKFSAGLGGAAACAALCLFSLRHAGWRPTFKMAAVLMGSALLAVLVLGAHPYVTNMLHKGHPLYPLAGPGAVDIMAGNWPQGFKAMDPPERFVRSFFASTSTAFDGGGQPKIPFTLRKPELGAAGEYGARLAGFGPFYSGAVLVAAVLAGWLLTRRDRTPAINTLLLGALATLALGLLMPESWWVRYAPQLWWPPVLVAVAASLAADRRLRLGGWALVAILALNLALVGASFVRYQAKRTFAVRADLAAMAAAPGPLCVYLGWNHARLELIRKAAPDARLVLAPLDLACHPQLMSAAFPIRANGASFCSCR